MNDEKEEKKSAKPKTEQALFTVIIIIICSLTIFFSFNYIKRKSGSPEFFVTENNSEVVRAVTDSTLDGVLININTATLPELCILPSIGEKKAQAIIDYRNDNGRFVTVEDIMKVSGIGEVLFEKIKNYITV